MKSIGELLLECPATLRALTEMDAVDRELFVDHVVLGMSWQQIEIYLELPRTTRERRWRRVREVLTVALCYRPALSEQCLECGTPFEQAVNRQRQFCSAGCRKRHWHRCGSTKVAA